jgi:NAD(P)-dependent dehydrogenase (short-subunit alcohol dehydrogenase family)
MAKGQGITKEQFLDEYFRKIGVLTGRWASLEEVSDTVVFLASDRARYINGAWIVVDGGYSINVP